MKAKLSYDKYVNLRDLYEKKVSRIANARMIMFIIMIVTFILKYYYYQVFFNVVFFLSLVSFIIMVIVHDKYFKVYDYYSKYVLVLDTYIARENGEWKTFKDNGNDFFDDKKYYLSDLDIMGDCSLFQYLSVCKTLGGREKLARSLSNIEVDRHELKLNQDLINELVDDIDFSINFQVMMNGYDGKNIHLSDGLEYYFKDNDKNFDIVIGFIFGFINVCLFILGLFSIISMGYFYGMFFFNLAISYLYVYIYKEDFRKVDKIICNYSMLYSVFELIANKSASSIKMKKYIKEMKSGLVSINQLKKLEGINSLRNNLLSSFLLNGIGCLNLFVMYKYSLFVNRYFDKLEKNISNIEELESFISLATIGIVKNNKCMPIYCDKISLEFNGLMHPLIDEKVCVSNDYDGNNGVNIITGSNMGGKTTFLRTIGINLILMQAGTFVCGESFSGSYFKIFTSMRVMDNIEKGISTFYGELLRIKDMVEYNGRGNMLVLIDEIFKGTNYNDRMYGAKEVVNKLNNKSTLAFITTHDFELCESSNISNYHVQEDYEGEKIIFDYKVRNGKCISTNARYLMDKLGIVNKK